VKLRRLQEVQKIIDDNMRAINVERVGTVQKILVDGISRKDANELRGRTECNRVVNFQAGPLSERLMHQLIDVRITEANPHSLRGEVVLSESVV
jgi:tRNA-2-methylthio-N6-dimethylallyladenosine synthase